MIERGHKPILDAISKMSKGRPIHWVRNLPTVLLADRSTIRTFTGFNPYYICCGSKPLLPIELKILTWRILPWDKIHSTADLSAVYARQLQRRDEDLEKAKFHDQRIRLEGKKRHDLQNGIRQKELAIESTVLLHDTRRQKDMSQMLSFKRLGPYRICDMIKDKDTYELK